MRRRAFLQGGAVFCAAGALPAAALADAASPFFRREGLREAPFGDAVSPLITHYARTAPYAATAGVLQPGGLAEVKALGFALLIDLRQPNEDGVAREAADAAALGVRRLLLSFSPNETAWAIVDAVSHMFHAQENYPVLMHCASGNRAGAVWALYRMRQGVPPAIALEEGRAAGMASTEALIRPLAGLPPL